MKKILITFLTLFMLSTNMCFNTIYAEELSSFNKTSDVDIILTNASTSGIDIIYEDGTLKDPTMVSNPTENDLLIYGTNDYFNYKALKYDGTKWIEANDTYKISALKLYADDVYVVGKGQNTFSIETMDELAYFFSIGGSAKLANDISGKDKFLIINGKECTLDLNQHTITFAYNGNTLDSNGSASLTPSELNTSITIKGNGKLDVKNGTLKNTYNEGIKETYLFLVRSNSKLVLDDVDAYGDNARLFYNEGTTEIKNGTFNATKKEIIWNKGQFKVKDSLITANASSYNYSHQAIWNEAGTLTFDCPNVTLTNFTNISSSLVNAYLLAKGGTVLVTNGTTIPGGIEIRTGATLSLSGTNSSVADGSRTGITVNGGGTLNVKDKASISTEVTLNNNANLNLESGTINKKIYFNPGAKLKIDASYTSSSKIQLQLNYNKNQLPFVITQKASVNQIDLLDVLNTNGIIIYDEVNDSEHSIKAKEDIQIIYDANGSTSGIVPLDETHYEKNTEVVVMSNSGQLEKTGYKFIGWNTKSDGSGIHYDEEGTFTITGSVTLYAQWEQLYQIAYEANESTSGIVPVDNNYYEKDADIVVKDNLGSLTKTGYKFIGWNTKSDGTGTTYLPGSSIKLASSNITLYALWSHSHDGIDYDKKLTGAATLTSGNYYLDSDISIDNPIIIGDNQNVRICLNGHVIDASSFTDKNVIQVGMNASLVIDDCKHDTAVHKYDIDSTTKLATLNDNGEKTIYGGAIYGGVKAKYDLDNGIRSSAIYGKYKSKITLNAINILGFNTSTGFLLYGDTASEISLGEKVNISNNITTNVISSLITVANKLIINGASIKDNTITQDKNHDSGYVCGAIIDAYNLVVNSGEIKDNNIVWDTHYSGLINYHNAEAISNLNISNNTIKNNTPYRTNGILIENEYGNVTLDKVTIANNSYSGSYFINGLVYAEDTLTIKNQTIINNNEININVSSTSSNGCGGLLSGGTTATINDSSITNNVLNYENITPCGAIIEVGYYEEGGLSIDNSSITNNTINANSPERITGALIYIRSKVDSTISNTNINANTLISTNDNDKGIAGAIIYCDNNEVKLISTNCNDNKVSSKGTIEGGLIRAITVSTSGGSFDRNNITSSFGSINGGLIKGFSKVLIKGSIFNNNFISSDCKDYADKVSISNDLLNETNVKRGIAGGLISCNYYLKIEDDNFVDDYENQIKNNTISLNGYDDDSLVSYGYLLNANNTEIEHTDISYNSIEFNAASSKVKSYALGGIYANTLTANDIKFMGNKATANSVMGLLSYADGNVNITNLKALNNVATSTGDSYGSLIYQVPGRFTDNQLILSGEIASNEVSIGGDTKGGLIYGEKLSLKDLKINNTNNIIGTSASGTIRGGVAYGEDLKIDSSTIDSNNVSYQTIIGLVGEAKYNLSLNDVSITNNLSVNTSTSGSQGVLIIDEDRYSYFDKDKYSFRLSGKIEIKDNTINGKEEGITLSCYGTQSNSLVIAESLSGTSYIPFSYLNKQYKYSDYLFYDDLKETKIKLVDFQNEATNAEDYLDCFVNNDKLFTLSSENNAIYYGTRVLSQPTATNCTYSINTQGLSASDTSYQWYRVIDGNESIVDGATSKTLDKSANNIGTNYCLASISGAGNYASEIINLEPTIEKQPTSNNNYIFEIKDNCSVDYQWYELNANSSNKTIVDDSVASETSFDYYDSYSAYTYTYESTYDKTSGLWSSSSGKLFAVDVPMKKGEILICNCDCDVDVYAYAYTDHNLNNYVYFNKAFIAQNDGTYTIVFENNFYDPENIKAVSASFKIYSNIGDIDPTIAKEVRYGEILGAKVYSKYNATNNSFEGLNGYYQAIKLNLTKGDIYIFEYDGPDIDYAYSYMVKETELTKYDSLDKLYDYDFLQAYECQESGTYYFVTRIYDAKGNRLYPNIKVKQINGYTLTDSQLSTNQLSNTFSGKYVCLAKCTDSSTDYYYVYSDMVDYLDTRTRVAQLKEIDTGKIIYEVKLDRDDNYDFGNVKAGLYELVIVNSDKKGFTTINLKSNSKVTGNASDLIIDNVEYQMVFKNNTPYCLVSGFKEFAEKLRSNDYTNKVSLSIAALKQNSSTRFNNLINLIKANKYASSNFLFFDINIDAIINGETTIIHEIDDGMITITLPFDTVNNDSIAIARCHIYDENEESYDLLPRGLNNANETGEYFEVYENCIELHLNMFSIYAIGYRPIVETESSSTTNGTYSYKVVKTAVE